MAELPVTDKLTIVAVPLMSASTNHSFLPLVPDAPISLALFVLKAMLPPYCGRSG